VLQQNVDFILLAEERAYDLDAAAIYRIEKLRGAELFENVLQRQLAQQFVLMPADRLFSRGQRQDRGIRAQASDLGIDPFPKLGVADKEDDLVDALQVGFLVSGFAVQGTGLAAAAAAPDPLCRFRILNQE
jgi:hypothetical protein